MGYISKAVIGLKALRELGLKQVADYGLYRFLLRSSYLTWRTKSALRAAGEQEDACRMAFPISLPDRQRLQDLLGSDGRRGLLEEAEQILLGKVRLFAGEPVPLDLSPAGSDLFWTDLELGKSSSSVGDIKLVWEVGRFGWAYTLGRAYLISGDERYPQAFWQHLETFLDANPPYFGHHWASAQEVALRLIALTFAAWGFDESMHSTPERKAGIGRAIAAHAARIPPTLLYARAQGNNHLLVEAVGLYTAGAVLPDHPMAPGWRESGWRWSNTALMDQISPDGSYVQQSTNYHRLMLQAALWLETLSASQGDLFTPAVRQRLAAAVSWLLALQDPITGQVPNLGPNDGAYILPLSSSSFRDYRPVLQAAWRAFLGGRLIEPGLWDEMAVWLPGRRQSGESDVDGSASVLPAEQLQSCKPIVLRGANSWAYLRAARFRRRPGHADQLHLDLWWQGMNIAQDAGTYLYNARSPWDNALSSTLVHNTVIVNGQDQMTRAGRFLWLDWAQASEVITEGAADGSWVRAAAQHDGYRRLGLLHRRVVTSFPEDGWLVDDTIASGSSRVDRQTQLFTARLHWLLPDCKWNLEQDGSQAVLVLDSPPGKVSLTVTWHAAPTDAPRARLQLVRAGELVAGEGAVSAVSGWYSPTYACKSPALSFSVELDSRPPLIFKSEWKMY